MWVMGSHQHRLCHWFWFMPLSRTLICNPTRLNWLSPLLPLQAGTEESSADTGNAITMMHELSKKNYLLLVPTSSVHFLWSKWQFLIFFNVQPVRPGGLWPFWQSIPELSHVSVSRQKPLSMFLWQIIALPSSFKSHCYKKSFQKLLRAGDSCGNGRQLLLWVVAISNRFVTIFR